MSERASHGNSNAPLGWWAISGEALLAMLRRCAQGENRTWSTPRVTRIPTTKGSSPMSESDNDAFRYCVHCKADCYADEPEHASDCPSMTNVFPITDEELGIRGPDDPYAHGMRCMDCGADFAVGDFYTLREVQAGNPLLAGPEGASVNEVICLGCAATEAAA